MAKDYYALLGVPRDATANQIKSAYRRQAKRVHPDACIGRDASGEPDAGGDRECFQDVQEAYETLNDPERRRAYDRQRARSPSSQSVPVRRPGEPMGRRVEPLRTRPKTARPVEPLAPEPLREPKSARERRLGREQRGAPEPLFSSSSPSAPEPLIPRDAPYSPESLFPPGRPQGTSWEGGASIGGDQVEQLYAEVSLTFNQAERGGRVDVWVPLQVACPECRGWGSWGFGICPRCAGRGRIAAERPLSLSFPGGIVDGQVTRLSLEQAGMAGVVLTVRFRVDEW